MNAKKKKAPDREAPSRVADTFDLIYNGWAKSPTVRKI
jgi:hypothetical protein